MNGYNFTERVRKVLAMSREEAAELNHEYVGTEHILLGVIREGEGVAATVLQNLNVDFDALQVTVLTTVKRGQSGSRGPDLPYTSRAKKVLELAMSEARELNHSYVGTEHLLLGLVREEKGIAAQVLKHAGVNLDAARDEVVRVLGTEVPRKHDRDWLAARDPLPRFPNRVRAVLDAAHEVASERGSIDVTAVHVMIALVEHGEGLANAALDRLGFDRTAAMFALNELAPAVSPAIGPDDVVSPASSLVAVLHVMEQTQKESHAAVPGTHHLLLGLVTISKEIAAVLAAQGIDLGKLAEEVRRISG